MNVKPGLWRNTSSTAKFVMLFQTMVIAFLSIWIYEEYLNNTYLQAYVNGVFATDGWVFGIVVVVFFLSGVTALFVRRNKSVEKNVEATSASLRVSSPVSIPSPKPASDLHPVVAALKAELAGMPVPLGMPVASVPPRKDEASQNASQTAGGQSSVQTIVPGSVRPDTVIVGGMPVLKKVEQENRAEDKSAQQA